MQQGGSQYGISPEVPQYNRSHVLGITGAHDLSAGHHSEHLQQQQPQQQLLQQQQKKSSDGLPEAASPISSRPPARSSVVNFDELVPVSGGFPDEEALAGEESERGTAGNRWPRQETLALLKIRSEMDSAFRDATLKGPLWEDVSRKLTELGYIRSAKKCKEKFENVHKYYKRTKEGRAGRQDGKSYRFFSQLEALHSSNPAPINQISSGIGSSSLVSNAGRVQSPAVVTAGAGQMNRNLTTPAAPTTTAPSSAPGLAQNLHGIAADLSAGIAAGISFSSGSSTSSSDSDGLEDLNPESRKRKRPDSSSHKMMDFFESLMKQVMEKQEAMQQRFLETIEKREHDRMIREEAWKRQEMAKLNREQEILAQERALSASRDATVIAFLQKIAGQTIQIPLPVTIQAPQPQSSLPPTQHHHQLHLHHQEPQPHQQPQQQQQQQQPQLQQQQQKQPPSESIRHVSSSDIVPVQEQEIGIGFDATSSRWPKSEVHALIKLRSGLDSRYQEAGPKGPLWEEISAGMNRLGYSRSAKRCKEKWENINKYFKKVKESNKKRPEDAKTCPYFHQLDALYRKKNLNSCSSNQTKQDPELLQQQQRNADLLAIMPPPPSETENKGSTTNNNDSYNEGNNAGGSGVQVPTSNGGLPASFFQSASEEDANKPEDIVKELIEQQQAVMDDYDKLEEPDSDNMEQDEEDEDEEEEQKLAYKVQFQRQNTAPSNGKAGSFLAMVQ